MTITVLLVWPSRKLNTLNVEMGGQKDFCLLTDKRKIVNFLPVNSCVVTHVPFVGGLLQKKGINPDIVHRPEIKYVNDVPCVDHLSSVKNVTNVPIVAEDLPIGARLHQFWEKWAALGASPKVVRVLKEDYTLPFWYWPNLTRSPTNISCYVNPHRNLYLLESLHQHMNKNAVEPVTTRKSLGFYNRHFLVPKPNNQWRPILDLSTLNKF